jgi:hypothetical protein
VVKLWLIQVFFHDNALGFEWHGVDCNTKYERQTVIGAKNNKLL